MSKILIDNWNLGDIVSEMIDITDSRISENYMELLTSIILWDNVYYPENDMSKWWNQVDLGLKNYIFPIKDEGKFSKEAEAIYNKYFSERESSVVATGSIRYSMLSNSLGMGYFPSNKRSVFLSKMGDFISRPLLMKLPIINRIDSLSIIDGVVMEKYRDITKYLPDFKIDFSYPLLVDYVVYNCDDQSSYLSVASQIKNEKSVVRYRKYMDEFEDALEEGNWSRLHHFTNDVNEIVEEILKITEKRSISVTGSISIMPSIDISTDIKLKKKAFHLDFLRDLSKFAFNKRKRNKI